MKRIITSIVCFAAVIAASADSNKALQGTKFTDNWSVGFNVGVIQPLAHPYSLGENIRPELGVEIYKQFTPVFKLGVEGMFGINTTGVYGNRGTRTAFDHSNLSLLGGLNLMNIFGGYNGTPRLFEIEAIGGIGWGHIYTNYNVDGRDYNFMSSKFGVNFNFNLGEEKAWTVALKPAIVYNIEGRTPQNGVRYDSNAAAFELTAGVAYHFASSNGKHHFTYARLYDQGEIDALNNRINSLRSDLENQSRDLDEASNRINELEDSLNDCRNRAPERIVETVTETKTNSTMESIVTFRQGKTTIDASQYPNVERVATYLNNHKEATVEIKGYASPEGSIEVNTRIANNRAQAVKNLLIKKYRIDANRIKAEGQGVGDMFSEPDWNRVSICTLVENDD